MLRRMVLLCLNTMGEGEEENGFVMFGYNGKKQGKSYREKRRGGEGVGFP